MSEAKQLLFNKMNKGKISNVLFEHKKNEGFITGFTPNYIRVGYPWNPGLAGRILKVRLKESMPDGKMSVELID